MIWDDVVITIYSETEQNNTVSIFVNNTSVRVRPFRIVMISNKLSPHEPHRKPESDWSATNCLHQIKSFLNAM